MSSKHLRARQIMIVWLSRSKICLSQVFLQPEDFDAGQCLAITKTIIELKNFLRCLGLVKNRPRGGRIFEDCTMVFYEMNMQSCLVKYNQLLYVRTYIHDVELSID